MYITSFLSNATYLLVPALGRLAGLRCIFSRFEKAGRSIRALLYLAVIVDSLRVVRTPLVEWGALAQKLDQNESCHQRNGNRHAEERRRLRSDIGVCQLKVGPTLALDSNTFACSVRMI